MLLTFPTFLGISVVTALGFALISAFNLLLVPYGLYSALEYASGPWRAAVALTAFAGVAAGFYTYRRWRSGLMRLRDGIIGSALIASSLLLSAFPFLASALERLRGRSLPDVYHTALWQVLLLAFGVFALGAGLLWQRRRGSTLSLHLRIASMLLAGFMMGVIALLVSCAGFTDPATLSSTNARLFTFISMTEFTASASAPSIVPLLQELGRYLDFFIRRTYLLPVYGALLAVALASGKMSSRYLWPSLMLAATGLVFMVICSFRYYTEQYWIYIDLFLIAAAALLVCGFMEVRQRVATRIAAVAIVVALYATQYPRVVETYPHYNPSYRDRIDLAAHAVHEVYDYAALMQERYGDDLGFMKRVLSDPRLNGSDRGIDLMAKPAIRRLIRSNPEVQAAAAQAGRY
jgi:hypothetical protein